MSTPIPSSQLDSHRRADDRTFAYAAAGLALGIIVLFWPSVGAEFVRLDDWQYVVENPLVRQPSASGLVRVFGEVRRPSTVDGYFQPLTMASLMLDGLLSGPEGPSPFVFHLSNVILHAAAAVLLMWVLREAVGGLWVPLLVAALFAAHPVQVEAVAWVSQRKTVLSGALAIASIGCFLRQGRTGRSGWLTGAFALYALATLAKPTSVLLPVLLPLLDRWPLRRPTRWLSLAPFAAVMVVTGLVAWISQGASGAGLATPKAGHGGAVGATAIRSLGQYAVNVVWPMLLSPYRPVPTAPLWADAATLVTLAVLVGVLALSWATRRRAPSLAVGMLGFVILLIPALGWVRFEETIVADRFLYLPLAMLLLPLAALAAHFASSTAKRANVAYVALAAYVVPLAALSHAQQGVWHDSLALWTYVAEVCPSLPRAQYELAAVNLDLVRPGEAVPHARRAVESNPDNSQYVHALARSLVRSGRAAEGLPLARRAVQLGLGPQQPYAFATLAEALVRTGDAAGARAAMEQARRSGDIDAAEYADLAEAAWREASGADLGVEWYDEALARRPGVAVWRWNRGVALERAGRDKDALEAYGRVLGELQAAGQSLPPEFVKAYRALESRSRAAASQPTTTRSSE